MMSYADGTTTRRVPNNTSGHYKRAVAISIDVIFGNIGGIISSNIFRAQDAPHYKLGRKFRSSCTEAEAQRQRVCRWP